MALTPNLIRENITGDGSTSVWNDETVYGGSNPDRNEVALYLTAYKVDENLIKTVLTVTSFDPEIVTQFITQNTIDGHYIYYFVIVNIYNNSTLYTKKNLVWDVSQNKFYEYVNNSDAAGIPVTNASYWSEISDPTLKIDTANNIVSQVIEKVVSYKTSICYLKAATKHAKECCGNSDGNYGANNKLDSLFKKIRNLFTNMTLDEARGLYTQGEKNARLAEKYCDDCGCLEE